MGNVKTNDTQYAFSIEPALSTPGTLWTTIVLTDVGQVGAEIETAESRPISQNRSRNKGAVVGLTSGFEFEADLTMSHMNDFGDMFLFSSWQGIEVYDPASIATDIFTVATGTALAVDSLVMYKGSGVAGNNGLHVVSAATTTTITVTSTLTDEASVPVGATVEHAGHEAAVGDLQIDANGDLISALLDFTTLPILVGGYLWIGGEATLNQFATAANRGRARILTITANLVTFDKTQDTFVIDSGATKEIHLYFPRHGTQVPVSDANYLEQSIHIEAVWPNLEDPGPGDMYTYAKGNHANAWTFNFANKSLVTTTIGFIGTDTDPPTTTRLTGAATPVPAVQDKVFNTAADFARLRIIDADGLGVSSSFKEMEITLSNNASPLECLETLGAVDINIGIFTVDLTAQILFNSPRPLEAIRNNETVTLDFSIQNDDGGFVVDIPSMTLGDGSIVLESDDTARLDVTGTAFGHPTLNSSLIIDIFPFIPTYV